MMPKETQTSGDGRRLVVLKRTQVNKDGIENLTNPMRKPRESLTGGTEQGEDSQPGTRGMGMRTKNMKD